MDFHESIDQCRDHIGKAKAAYCLCDYDEALILLAKAWTDMRTSIDLVYNSKLLDQFAESPAGEDGG